MSTRRESGVVFDHGAQYLTARHPDFVQQVRAWRSERLVQAWKGRLGTLDEHGRVSPESGARWVGVPGMSALCRNLAEGLSGCRYGWHVESLRRGGDSWLLQSRSGDQLEADALVISTPPSQAAALLSGTGVEVGFPDVRMQPCWTVMAMFDRPLLPGWDGLSLESGPLAWVVSQASKPGRSTAPAWVLQASAAWSESQVEASRENVCNALLRAARQLSGAQDVSIKYAKAHRWRFARPSAPLSSGPVHCIDYRLVVTGDWCLGSRIENAYLSGEMAARLLLSQSD